MPKLQVLFVIDSLHCGGAEKSLISLLPLLDYSRIDVDLMLVDRGGVFEQYVPKEVTIVSLPRPHGLWTRLCQGYFSLLLRMFPTRHAAELRWTSMSSAYQRIDKQYDVAIAYQQGFPTYFVADKVKSRKKCAWINADLEKVRYRKTYNRPYYDRMDVVVPVSDILRQRIIDAGFTSNDNIYTVYDILNVDLIRQMAQEKLDSEKKKSFTLVTVGRMVALKGYDLAVNAAKILKSQGIDFDWYFVGDGGQHGAIEQQIADHGLKENIHLVGMTPNPYPYMAAADIYVQTSRFEGFGLTLTEARILNRPVISTNFPVVYNQIQDGENGVICEMTAESIAEKIQLLMNDETLRQRIISATREEINTTAKTEPEKVMKIIMS